ncbi:hypothetical protein JCM3766R1_004847 [Sporobolomyces carnicolor]
MHHERIDPPRPVVTAKRSTLNHRDGERSPHPHSDRPSSLTDVEKATPTTYPDSNDDRRGGNNDDDDSGFLFKLGRHFVGTRDSRSFKSPIVRPLAKLSPKHEGYLVAFLGAFVAILGACAISFAFKDVKGFRGVTPLAIGSLGATAVLLYCVPESPLSQPRNVVGGHVVSAVSGAIVSQLFALDSRFTTPLDVDNAVVDDESWYHLTPVAYALAVAIAISAMQLTKTVHPPGGATALIASAHRTVDARYTYLLDIFLAVTWMTLWSCFVNNLGRKKYPTFWWTPTPSPQPQLPRQSPKSSAK